MEVTWSIFNILINSSTFCFMFILRINTESLLFDLIRSYSIQQFWKITFVLNILNILNSSF